LPRIASTETAMMFKETHPIMGTRDIRRAIEFYTQRLGFQLAFGDESQDPPNYVGFRRDAVVLHMQFYRQLTPAERT
jgi:catechol 2,3-dioxygenase-like lactoylglutathione lyase family enzyme